jgi:predicted dehydrogenase
VRVLVIGCGSIGSRHARNLRQLGAEVGIFDTSHAARFFAPETVGRIFDQRQAGIEWAEAVVIASPARFHLQHLLETVAFKRPTFVEKPLALSSSDTVRSVLGMTERWEVPVQVGYNLRFHPKWQEVRTRARSGELGPIRSAVYATASDLHTWHGTSYADTLAECSHEIDQALWTLGPATCVGAHHSVDGRRWDLLLAHGDVVSHVHLSTIEGHYRREAAVYGHLNYTRYVKDSGSDVDDMYFEEMRHFLEVAAGAAAPRCTLQDGLAVLEIMDHARRIAG